MAMRVLQAEGILQGIENFFTPILCCGPISNGAYPAAGQFSAKKIRGVRSMGSRLTATESREKTDRLMQRIEDQASGAQTNIEDKNGTQKKLQCQADTYLKLYLYVLLCSVS